MFLDANRDIQKHRDRLPHWHQGGTLVFLTWRLADSLPEAAVARILELREAWREQNPKPWPDSQAAEYNRRFILPLEDKLDDSHGDCVLRQKEVRRIVCDALHYFDQDRYELDAYVVMPNHVHTLLLLSDQFPLKDVVHSLKSYTAKEINKFLGQDGKLWQRGYWDRLIRSEKQLNWTRSYIAKNPEKLQLGDYSLWHNKERRPPA